MSQGQAVMDFEQAIMSYEQIVMQIIINGGDARAKSIKAIRSAREGDIGMALELMDHAGESLAKAHKTQTNLIQAEARGEKTEMTLLMVHAQDHLMNAMTVKDLAVEMIEESKLRIALEKKLEEMMSND